MIETTADLAAACKELAKSDFITIDTEFLRETTFWPELCLIQMASPTTEVLVDPLAKGIDLAPFFELMADTKVLKVFHAGDEGQQDRAEDVEKDDEEDEHRQPEENLTFETVAADLLWHCFPADRSSPSDAASDPKRPLST